MRKRSLRQNNSGQVLIITSLLVALILLSTSLYVIQTAKNLPVAQSNDSGFLAYQMGARNTVISALANATNGGDSDVLASDLTKFSSAIVSQSYQSLLQVQADASNSAPYQNGLWISWGTSGYGVSSACANFVFGSIGNKETSSSQFNVNFTSEISYSGSY
jgi:hypothetical protein